MTSQQQWARSRIHSLYRFSQPATIQRICKEALPAFDILLFGGELGSRIPVVWRDLGRDLWGQTLGGRPRHPGPIRVVLAETLVPLTALRPDMVWGTLVHELLHVYALRRSAENE